MSATVMSRWVCGAALAAATILPASAFQVVIPWDYEARLVGAVARSFLGVDVCEVDKARAGSLNLKEERGVEITRVAEESPAARAGLKAGDVVLEFNGQRVEGTEQFVRLVRETPVGREVRLSVSRSGAPVQVNATIGTRKTRALRSGDMETFRFDMPRIDPPEIVMPDMPRVFTSWRSASLGIEAESVESQLAEYFGVKTGVLVRSVAKGSPAEKAGLKAGDVITKVDTSIVATLRDLSRAIRLMRDKRVVPLSIVREKRELALSVTLDDETGATPPPGPRSIRVRNNVL